MIFHQDKIFNLLQNSAESRIFLILKMAFNFVHTKLKFFQLG